MTNIKGVLKLGVNTVIVNKGNFEGFPADMPKSLQWEMLTDLDVYGVASWRIAAKSATKENPKGYERVYPGDIALIRL
jgi:hypothetical protein